MLVKVVDTSNKTIGYKLVFIVKNVCDEKIIVMSGVGLDTGWVRKPVFPAYTGRP